MPVTNSAQDYAAESTIPVLVYSDNSDTRQNVINAIGRRPGKGMPLLEWTECATSDAVMTNLEKTEYKLLVLDGESAKVGGMAVARDITARFESPAPIIMLVARQQDEWLAKWANAVETIPSPWNSIDLQQAATRQLKRTGH